jgi:hypothetical protein
MILVAPCCKSVPASEYKADNEYLLTLLMVIHEEKLTLFLSVPENATLIRVKHKVGSALAALQVVTAVPQLLSMHSALVFPQIAQDSSFQDRVVSMPSRKSITRSKPATFAVAVEGLHGESKFDKGSELLYHKTLLPPMATATVMASPDLMGWSWAQGLTTWLVSTVVVAAAVSAKMSICNPPTLGSPRNQKKKKEKRKKS